VVFPPDYNSAAVTTLDVYQTYGQLWTLVVTKQDSAPDLFTTDEAKLLLEQGAMRLDWAGHEVAQQKLVLTAVGSYQLEEVIKASNRLAERHVPHSVVYLFEPGRFRIPRSHGEREHQVATSLRESLYPEAVPSRLFVVHTRPEPLLGTVQPLNTGHGKTRALGFAGQGGTLTARGMLFVNKCTWAHVLAEAAELLNMPAGNLLHDEELAVLEGHKSPEGIVI
jgi:phosphoketolase